MSGKSNGDQPVKTYAVWNSTLKRKASLPKNRTPIKKSSKPIERKTKPKQVSEKRKRENKIYSVERVKFLTENPTCQAKLDGCTHASTEVHHKAGRHAKFLQVDLWLAICRNCHEYVTLHTREARVLHLSVTRHDPPADKLA